MSRSNSQQHLVLSATSRKRGGEVRALRDLVGTLAPYPCDVVTNAAS